MTKMILRAVRNGWLYGVFFALLSLWFGFPLLFTSPKTGVIMAISVGALAWIINGLIFNRFTKSIKDLDSIQDPALSGALITLESPANYYIDEHIVSGKLFLTQTRLIFIAHKKSGEDSEQYQFYLSDVSKFKFFRSIFNPGGEFMMIDKDGNQFVFEVDNLRIWKGVLTH